MWQFLQYLERVGPDGIIVQDLGVAKMAAEHFPKLALHASTQMNVASAKGVNLLSRRGFKRAVLARELSLDEIRADPRRHQPRARGLRARLPLRERVRPLPLLELPGRQERQPRGLRPGLPPPLRERRRVGLLVLARRPPARRVRPRAHGGGDRVLQDRGADEERRVRRLRRRRLSVHDRQLEARPREGPRQGPGHAPVRLRAPQDDASSSRGKLDARVHPSRPGRAARASRSARCATSASSTRRRFALLDSYDGLAEGDSPALPPARRLRSASPPRCARSGRSPTASSSRTDADVRQSDLVYLVQSQVHGPPLRPCPSRATSRATASSPATSRAPELEIASIRPRPSWRPPSALPEGSTPWSAGPGDLHILNAARPRKAMLLFNRANAEVMRREEKDAALQARQPRPLARSLLPRGRRRVARPPSSSTGSAGASGIFVANNPGHLGLLRGLGHEAKEALAIVAGPYLYAFNRWAASFLLEEGARFIVPPLEISKQDFQRVAEAAPASSLDAHRLLLSRRSSASAPTSPRPTTSRPSPTATARPTSYSRWRLGASGSVVTPISPSPSSTGCPSSRRRAWASSSSTSRASS